MSEPMTATEVRERLAELHRIHREEANAIVNRLAARLLDTLEPPAPDAQPARLGGTAH